MTKSRMKYRVNWNPHTITVWLRDTSFTVNDEHLVAWVEEKYLGELPTNGMISKIKTVLGRHLSERRWALERAKQKESRQDRKGQMYLPGL